MPVPLLLLKDISLTFGATPLLSGATCHPRFGMINHGSGWRSHWQSSNAPLDQIFSTFTGRYTDQTMWYLIGGIVLVLAGGLLTIFGRRS